MLLSTEHLGGIQVRMAASQRARGAQDVGQGGRTPWEPGVGERLRGPDSRTGVRTAGRSDIKSRGYRTNTWPLSNRIHADWHHIERVTLRSSNLDNRSTNRQ